MTAQQIAGNNPDRVILDELEPQRVQRSRRKGWKMPANTVYVGRPTKWGNPWSPKNSTHITMARGLAPPNPVESSRPMTVAECVEAYRQSIDAREFGYGRDEIRAELAGKNLACFCALDAPCHADVLLEIANAPPREVRSTRP